MQASLFIPDRLTHYGLDAALTGLQSLAQVELAHGHVPYLYESGVVYEREPRGTEHWLAPSLVWARGAADCEDLAAWRAGELVVSGEDPHARTVVVRTGPRTWHAVVLRGDGTYEDPSAVLGMTGPGGMVAPVRFSLSPETRDYRARVALQGLGQWEDVEHVDGNAMEALAACFGAMPYSSMGQIPFVGPVVDIFSDIVDFATGRKKTPPATQAPPTVQRPEPSQADQESLDASVLRLARQMKAIAQREASRRLTKAQRAVRQSSAL